MADAPPSESRRRSVVGRAADPIARRRLAAPRPTTDARASAGERRAAARRDRARARRSASRSSCSASSIARRLGRAALRDDEPALRGDRRSSSTARKRRTAERASRRDGRRRATAQNIFALDLDTARAQLLARPVDQRGDARAPASRRRSSIARRRARGRARSSRSATSSTSRRATANLQDARAGRPERPPRRHRHHAPSRSPTIATASTHDPARARPRRATTSAAGSRSATRSRRSTSSERRLAGRSSIGKSAITLALGAAAVSDDKLEQAARVLAELDRRGAKADAIILDNEARPRARRREDAMIAHRHEIWPISRPHDSFGSPLARADCRSASLRTR